MLFYAHQRKLFECEAARQSVLTDCWYEISSDYGLFFHSTISFELECLE